MTDQPTAGIPFTDLPEGTVTFLFTDIEGSTQLLKALGEKARSFPWPNKCPHGQAWR